MITKQGMLGKGNQTITSLDTQGYERRLVIQKSRQTTYNRPMPPKEWQDKIRIGFQELGFVIFSLIPNNKQYIHL